MTVIDLSVLSAFWLGGPAREAAERLYLDHPDWAAPVAWRSDFRRVLDTWVSFEQIDAVEASQIWNAALCQLEDREFFSGSVEVLELVAVHGLGRVDAEVVAFARAQGLRFHTTNPRLARRFPDHAVLLDEVAGSAAGRSIRKVA
jgi:predicted nucleic acid-binding protein